MHNSVAPARSFPKLRPVKPTSLLLVFLSVAFALTGCNKKPSAPAEQQPVAEQQRVPARASSPNSPPRRSNPPPSCKLPSGHYKLPFRRRKPQPRPRPAVAPAVGSHSSLAEVAAPRPGSRSNLAATAESQQHAPEVAALAPEVAESPPQALASTQQEGAPPNLNAKQCRAYPDARTPALPNHRRSAGHAGWAFRPADRFASIFRHRRFEWSEASSR